MKGKSLVARRNKRWVWPVNVPLSYFSKILLETTYRSLFLGSTYYAPQRAWKGWLFRRRIFLILPIGTAWACQNILILISVLQIPPVSLAEDSEVLWRSRFVLVSYSQQSGLAAEPQALLIFGVLPVGCSPPGPSPEAPSPTFLPPKGSQDGCLWELPPGCSPKRRGVRWAALCLPWWFAFVSLFYPSGTWLLKIVQVWTGRCFICPLREDQN